LAGISCSSDGEMIVTAGRDNRIRVWKYNLNKEEYIEN